MTNEQAEGAAAAPAAAEVSLEDVQRRTLQAVNEALERGEHEAAHCLAETYGALVYAATMSHEAMRAAAENALRKLAQAEANARAKRGVSA